jgi:copper(I)-binding protein
MKKSFLVSAFLSVIICSVGAFADSHDQKDHESTASTNEDVYVSEENLINISDQWIRSAIAGKNTAAYLTLSNDTDRDFTLVGISDDDQCAEKVEIHSYKIEVNDVKKMHRVDNISVPAHQKVVFKPGAAHIMLMNLNKQLIAHEKYAMTLTLKSGDDVITKTAQFPVKHAVTKRKHKPADAE